MTTPLSQRQLDELRPEPIESLILHSHSESGNMGWLLVNGRYLSNQEVEALEAERDRLKLENSNLNGGIDDLIEERDTLKALEARVKAARDLLKEVDCGMTDGKGVQTDPDSCVGCESGSDDGACWFARMKAVLGEEA